MICKPYFTTCLLIISVTSAAWGLDTAPTSLKERLWHLAKEEQTLYQQDNLLINNNALNRFIQQVSERLWRHANSELPAPSISIVIDIEAQAVTYANGKCYLTTGMLRQLQNEHQLAMILAHEIIHYVRQHTIGLYQYSAPLTPNANGEHQSNNIVIDQIIQNAEHQADEEGFALFQAAGYCPKEFLALLTNFIAFAQTKGQVDETARLITRKTHFEHLLKQSDLSINCAKKRDDTQNNYENIMAPVLLANAQLAIQLGYFNPANTDLSRYLKLRPQDAQAYFLKGQLFSQCQKGSNMAESITYFEKAIELNPKLASAHKALGVIYFKASRYQEAKRHFEAVITLAPQDTAIKYFKEYLRLCQD